MGRGDRFQNLDSTAVGIQMHYASHTHSIVSDYKLKEEGTQRTCPPGPQHTVQRASTHGLSLQSPLIVTAMVVRHSSSGYKMHYQVNG